MMQKTRLFLITIIAILITSNIYFAFMYVLGRMELAKTEELLLIQEKDEKTLLFAKLFVDKVLLGERSVGFEDRLKLENAVRDVNDQQIFDQWQRFTKSASDQEAQQEVGVLFKLLLDKISQ